MITVAVPDEKIAALVGEVEGARFIPWNCLNEDSPVAERDAISVVFFPHNAGGRRVFSRLDVLPNLRVVHIPSAGYEHALGFVPPGVALCNARGFHDSRTAEMAIALALASQRLLPQFFEAQQRGTWDPEYFNPSLADRRALVVGYGSIGAAIGSRLRALEVEVEGVATTARTAPDGTVVHASADLQRVLPTAELVFVVTPHNDETEKLVDAEFLAAMPDGALLVNVGRGAVVDTDALVAECASGRLRAALDVIDPEPLPDGHPAWTTPNMIIVPHVAGLTELTNKRYIDVVREQARALVEGREPINLVAVGPYSD